MKTLLQILIIEDSENDALLVLNRIKKGSYLIEYKIVDNAIEMRTALNEKKWDLVLSDYSMPHFNGLKALEIIKESSIDIPFILISGTIGEEIAVEAMRAGAHDYIMKNNLHRLLPAIEREIGDAKCRDEQRLLEQKQKKTENELRESEERNRLITENTADTITMLDLDFNVIYTSPSVKKLRGYTPEEAMSQSLKQILTPKSYEKAKKLFNEQIMFEANKTSDPTRSVLLELEAYHKNGTIIWIEISVSVIRDNDLNPVRLLVVSRDITHRRLAEEQLQILSFAVEQSPAMILITDTEGIIEYANHKFIELTGYSKDELLGKKPGIIKSGKMPNSLYREMWNTIKANKIWYGEIINKTKDGKLYWVNIVISPIIDKDGNVFHFVGLAEDITSRKRTEDELIIAKERAEQSDRLKTAFLRSMSHEIRTPMNAIIGFSELMVSEFNDKEKLEAFSKIILNQCLDLLSIIDGIIDIAKIESGILSICLTNCNLMELFKELKIFFEDYKKRINKLSIEFELNINSYPPDLIIKIDVIKLRQIFINLINNAFKFSEVGKIEGGCKSDEDHELIFFVSDTGIGIPADKQKIIFDRFLKLNQDTTKFQIGSGLGLSIAKELVDLMGGKIWLESEPGKGSTFYFSIPYQIVKN